MVLIYQPIEITNFNKQKEISLEEENTLYTQYLKVKNKKYKLEKFIFENIDKINYIGKYLDINYFVNSYLEKNFLHNYITPDFLKNIEEANHDKFINVTNMISINYNFCLDVFNERISMYKKPPRLDNHLNLFLLTNNEFFKSCKILPNNKKPHIKYENNKLYISFQFYQNLNKISCIEDYDNLKHPETKYCYMCKNHTSSYLMFTKNSMCYDCGYKNYNFRKLTGDFSRIRAYVSGCRHTIGYEITLWLLRHGAHVIGSTRFPNSALFNYSNELDYDKFKDRLKVIKCDFLNISDINYVLEELSKENINTFISNAFQTVRQSPTYYKKVHLLENKVKNLIMDDLSKKKIEDNSITVYFENHNSNEIVRFMENNEIIINQHKNIVEDRTFVNQWTKKITEIDIDEILECNIINQIIPTLLFQKILEMFESNKTHDKYFMINVSSTEANHQNPNHVITSMNKIAMFNLIDRMKLGLSEKFYLYSSDPGFVTGVINDNEKPLDSFDGAIRVLYPMIEIINGNKEIYSKEEQNNFFNFTKKNIVYQ